MPPEMDLAQRVNCPCCGYPTLDTAGTYEICELCGWEDDGQTEAQADEVWGGPNHHHSLRSARQNFKRYLNMFEPNTDPRIGGGDSEREREAKRRLIEAFEWARHTSAEQAATVLLEVHGLEAILEDETFRKIQEYEASHRDV